MDQTEIWSGPMSRFFLFLQDDLSWVLYNFKRMENSTCPYWQRTIVKCLPGYNSLSPTIEHEKPTGREWEVRQQLQQSFFPFGGLKRGKLNTELSSWSFTTLQREVLTYLPFTCAFKILLIMYLCLLATICSASIFSLLSVQRHIAAPL